MKTIFLSKRIKLFALCLSGFLSLGSLQFEAQAQDAPQQWRFSLEEAAAHALEHNTAMIKANLAVRQAEAAKWEAIASYLPQLNVNVNYNNYLGASLDLFGQTIPMDPSSTLTLQASQLIFNANAILGMQLSELSRQMSE
ncbi:MAG: TolC family protein, partial [Bacteroidales bacterium]|nr:TolC family protein [Bacteroidales bacterium]